MNYGSTKLIVLMIVLFSTSLGFGFTDAPGPRKGILFRDSWDRTWFLRGSVPVSKSIEEAAGDNIGKPIVLDVTELVSGVVTRGYIKGSVRPDVACQNSSDALKILIRPVFLNDDLTTQIPALEIYLQNLGDEEFIIREDCLMIHIFKEPDAIAKIDPRVAGSPRPVEGMPKQLKDIQCEGTQFASFQHVWEKEPNLSHGETHKMTVPLFKYTCLWRGSEYRKKVALTSDTVSLSNGTYQVIVSYFHDFYKMRRISNAVEFSVKGKENSQPAG